ncbi:glycosylphosphatidylinositol-anchored high density lipoprotein-binding protein 1 [Talpa occidentalis]|uniref:glycosylphosphatidylinositol-anchored high density lipoprotein-binding protein 1 n=1 Tax=Talpa occidentalis TaxID=50954 RepID=UPI00188FF18C|nr:glycosylphosphatidylinositol-anchored high density lipoprotein-binding protein 1 [Talpa occidentalis]
MPPVPLPTEAERLRPWTTRRRGMKALTAVLLALLLCGRPGGGQAQDEGADEEDPRQEGYDEDDEEDEEDEQDKAAGGRGAGLRCYSCQSLHRGEGCGLRQNCSSSHAFCKTILSHGDTESGPLTTYSAWCSDTCRPISRTVAGTLMTVVCCQSALCNVPPWQGQPGARRGRPRGAPRLWPPASCSASFWSSARGALRCPAPAAPGRHVNKPAAAPPARAPPSPRCSSSVSPSGTLISSPQQLVALPPLLPLEAGAQEPLG